MQIRALLVLAGSLLLTGCSDTENDNATAEQPVVNEQTAEANQDSAENKLALVCDNNYLIEATYYRPDADGIMTQLTLKVTNAGKTEQIEMIPAVAASGAKFETPDQKTSFWEHQDEFTLSVGDQDVSVCKESSKEDDYTTQSGKTFIVKEDNSQSANLSKITLIAKGFTDTDIHIDLGEKDPIANVFLADVNQDGFEEIYIATTSAGAGSYGSLFGFASINDKAILPITLPAITDQDRQQGGNFEGYKGRDDFYADNSSVVRDFPVYQEIDHSVEPTGGRRLVYYALTPGEAAWQLKVIKSEKVD